MQFLIPPPLPEFRLSDEFAFSRVGVDFAGPMYVRVTFAKGGGMNKVLHSLIHMRFKPSCSS